MGFCTPSEYDEFLRAHVVVCSDDAKDVRALAAGHVG